MAPKRSDSTAEQNLPALGSHEQSEWFYTQRGETYSPVSSTDLRAAAHLGFLGPDDLVCRKDRDTWIIARTIHGLFKDVTSPKGSTP